MNEYKSLLQMTFEASNPYDIELRRALESVRYYAAHHHHMDMDWRIKNELSKRAFCGGLNEEATINMAIKRDKLALLSDIRRREIARKHNLYYSATLDKFVSIPED